MRRSILYQKKRLNSCFRDRTVSDMFRMVRNRSGAVTVVIGVRRFVTCHQDVSSHIFFFASEKPWKIVTRSGTKNQLHSKDRGTIAGVEFSMWNRFFFFFCTNYIIEFAACFVNVLITDAKCYDFYNFLRLFYHETWEMHWTGADPWQ